MDERTAGPQFQIKILDHGQDPLTSDHGPDQIKSRPICGTIVPTRADTVILSGPQIYDQHMIKKDSQFEFILGKYHGTEYCTEK